MEIDSISFTLGFFLAVFSQAAITLRGYEFFPLPLCFLPRCPRLFSLSLSLSFYFFFFLSCSRCAVPRAHTHRYIERVRSFARSTFSFYLREYVASSLIEFIHPSKWKSDQRSFSSTILFSSDHFAELFLPPLFSLFPPLFIHLPRRVNRPPLSLQ